MIFLYLVTMRNCHPQKSKFWWQPWTSMMISGSLFYCTSRFFCLIAVLIATLMHTRIHTHTHTQLQGSSWVRLTTGSIYGVIIIPFRSISLSRLEGFCSFSPLTFLKDSNEVCKFSRVPQASAPSNEMLVIPPLITSLHCWSLCVC